MFAVRSADFWCLVGLPSTVQYVDESVTRAQRQSFGHDWCASGCQTHEDGSSPKENVS